MKRFIILSVSLLMLTFCALALPNYSLSVNANSETNQLVIQAYGDSISYGYALDDVSKAYPSLFAQHYKAKFNTTFYANAVSGYTTTDLLNQLQPYINGSADDMDVFNETNIVLLCIGANNVLGPAVNSIYNYLTGGMSEQELRTLLDSQLEQFKQDYPQILNAFAGKKIISMTVYNPYKYSQLTDIRVDSSVSTANKLLIYSLITNYNAKFQQMLDISMEYLETINNEIRKTACDDIYVVDVWNMFANFSETEYTNYLNCNTKKINITNEDISNLTNGNFDALVNKFYIYCDPHPTEFGHEVIAKEHLKNFNLFQLSRTESLNEQNIKTSTLTVTSILDDAYTYRFYKRRGNNSILIKETTENSISIASHELITADEVYVEVYSSNELVETSNNISIPHATQNNTNTSLIIICSLGSTLLVASVCTGIVIYRKKKKFKL